MTALTFATERLQIAKKRFKELQAQELSPTTPGTAKKCILPTQYSTKHPSKNVFRQLHKRGNGQIYYVTPSQPNGIVVDPADPRIYFTCAARDMGYQITDGKDIKVHHRDV